jgi:hypothetical protein
LSSPPKRTRRNGNNTRLDDTTIDFSIKEEETDSVSNCVKHLQRLCDNVVDEKLASLALQKAKSRGPQWKGEVHRSAVVFYDDGDERRGSDDFVEGLGMLVSVIKMRPGTHATTIATDFEDVCVCVCF